MKKLYVAIDVGCHECGVGSEVIGTYLTKEEAKIVAEQRATLTKCWRDGGQSLPQVFEIEVPEEEV